MNKTKLQQNPVPIDRVAARVVRKAGHGCTWDPEPKPSPCRTESGEILRTAALPVSAPKDLLRLIGARRGRMQIMGYALEQSANKPHGARWVVRCDCGRYEHRTRIMRWLQGVTEDMCRLCLHRNDLKSKSSNDRGSNGC